MKKVVYLPLFLLMISAFLNGQGSDSGISAYAGPSLFSLRTNIEDKFTSEYGFSYRAGLGHHFKISHLVSIEARIFYENNKLIEYNAMLSQSIMQFNYIGIPIKVRRYIGAKKKAYLSFGVFTSYLTKAIIKDYSVQDEFLARYSIYDYFKKLNFGFATSLGYEIPISKKMQFCFELENSLGTRIINVIIDNKSIYNYRWKTNNLSLLFGISYRIDRY